MSKYSKSFERDFKWYLKMRHKFNFDGAAGYINKKGQSIIVYDKTGVDGKEAFYSFDAEGKIKPTKHPLLLKCLLRTKGSANLHIKMYAEDVFRGRMIYLEMRALCIHFKAPAWFREAIENTVIRFRKQETTNPLQNEIST